MSILLPSVTIGRGSLISRRNFARWFIFPDPWEFLAAVLNCCFRSPRVLISRKCGKAIEIFSAAIEPFQ
jgi:hypothetical protein